VFTLCNFLLFGCICWFPLCYFVLWQNVDGVNYFHVKVVGLLFVATTRVNVSPSLVLELLQRIARVIKDYLGILNEDSLRKNFVLVYELLDEVIVSFPPSCIWFIMPLKDLCFLNFNASLNYIITFSMLASFFKSNIHTWGSFYS